MEIRNNAEALKSFLGVSSSAAAKSLAIKRAEAEELQAIFAGDQATLSQVGTAVSGAAGLDGVRLDKVAAVQQALAAGTYNVSAAKVADKVIDSMLAPNTGPER
jgi:negative regulator of flagellin synthesis FlgM